MDLVRPFVLLGLGVSATGCGRVGYGDRVGVDGGGDSGIDAGSDAGLDAAVDAGRDDAGTPTCDWSTPPTFSAETRLLALEVGTLAPLGLVLAPEGFYVSLREASRPNRDLYLAPRLPDGTPGVPTLLADYSSASTDLSLEPFLDGAAFALVADRDGTGPEELYEAFAGSPTPTIVRRGEFDTVGTPERGAHVDATGLRITYSASHGGPSEDLYQATRTAVSSAFDPYVRIDELSTTSMDAWPAPFHGELDLVFVSDRGGRAALYHAHRPTPDAPFDAPVLVLQHPSLHLLDPFVTEDGCTLLVTRSSSVTGAASGEALRFDVVP